jgi:DNA recombination protein Rad52
MKIFDEQQKKLLAAPYDAKNVAILEVGSNKGSRYFETFHVIDEANRIFGYDGWSYTVTRLNKVYELAGVDKWGKEQWNIGFEAIVKVTLIGANGTVTREDVGVGENSQSSYMKAYDTASKASVSDALKRALRTFGNQFGNALYDKDKVNIERNEGDEFEPNKSSVKNIEKETQKQPPTKEQIENMSGLDENSKPYSEIVKAMFATKSTNELDDKIAGEAFNSRYDKLDKLAQKMINQVIDERRKALAENG